MNELKKCCRYCSNFRNNTCQLELFEIPYIDGCFLEDEFDESELYVIEDKIIQGICPKNPDDFYCKYYT